MANDGAKTWQPTPNGAFVLYGVRGHKDGFGVQPAPDRREPFYKAFNEGSVAKKSTGGWEYPEFPSEKRGTWDAERVDADVVKLTLKMGNQTVWVGKVKGSSELPEDRPDPFDP